MSRLIELPCYGIKVLLTTPDPERSDVWLGAGAAIQSELKEPCTHCGEKDCHHSCDGSQGADEPNSRDNGRDEYNAAMDAVESMILASACAGIDITSPRYLEVIETVVAKVANEYGE